MSQETRVGHWLKDDCDVYAGRGKGGRDLLSVETPGARGWLGNPHTVEDHGRGGAIVRFRKAFEHRLETDPGFREAVEALHGKVLGCWCQRLYQTEPLCHAEVIALWADRLADESDATPEPVTDGGVAQGVPENHIRTGERELISPLTGRPYIVTKWVDLGDGRFKALRKSPVEDRLFVPLKTEHYRNFALGEKDIELRGLNANFNPETVLPGRWAELRHGYSGDSLWRRIEHIWLFDHLTNIAEGLDHTRVLPDSTRDEFEASVRDLLGDYGRWIAFQLAKPALPGDVRP